MWNKWVLKCLTCFSSLILLYVSFCPVFNIIFLILCSSYWSYHPHLTTKSNLILSFCCCHNILPRVRLKNLGPASGPLSESSDGPMTLNTGFYVFLLIFIKDGCIILPESIIHQVRDQGSIKVSFL